MFHGDEFARGKQISNLMRTEVMGHKDLSLKGRGGFRCVEEGNEMK